MEDQLWEKLFTAAKTVRALAYAPYSKFQVGAAVASEDGEIFSGCNVENISFGLTICAERNTFCQAIAKGHSKFTHIAIIANTSTPVSPCGACRQFMAEFGDLVVRSYCLDGSFCESQLSELLPRALDGILEEPPQR